MSYFKIYNKDNVISTNNMQSTFPTHTHKFYEIYCFRSGNVMFSAEGNVYPLEPEDIMIFNKAETHHLILKNNASYSRIFVHFAPTQDLDPEFGRILLAPFKDRTLGMHNLYPARLSPDSKRIFYLEQICKTEDKTKQQLYLMALLHELSDDFPKIQCSPIAHSKSATNKITHYINKHIMDDLSIEHLCEHFYISKSQLHRNFKNELGITIGDYILSKRLVRAQNLIQKGGKSTNVYLDCGFKNYTTFFKAYKKKFGYAPSKEIENMNNIAPQEQIT